MILNDLQPRLYDVKNLSNDTTWLLHTTNRKWYVPYWTLPSPMTLNGRQGHFSYFCGIIFRFLIESPGDLMKHDIADDFECHFRYNKRYRCLCSKYSIWCTTSTTTVVHYLISLHLCSFRHSTCTVHVHADNAVKNLNRTARLRATLTVVLTLRTD